MRILFLSIWIILSSLYTASIVRAENIDETRLAEHIIPPYSLGEVTEIEGVWDLLNGSGLKEGFVIQSEAITPLPGFSGAPMNILILLDLQGNIIEAKLINQSEPIFVSGLGEAPLNKFLEQYRGRSISDSIVVGNQYGAGSNASALVYLDGVTKATASVRIAHESIIGSAREVAKHKIQGLVNNVNTATPKLDYIEELSWSELVQSGLAKNLVVTNAEIDAKFKDTLWQYDDPEAQSNPNENYIDLWLIDITPPAIARTVLSEKSLDDLDRLRDIAPNDEFFLLIESARHGLVSEEFVRNTSPDWVTASQSNFPIALRDADIVSDPLPELPKGKTLILRTDRRLGFSPISPWQLELLIVREHGSFQAEIGSVIMSLDYQSDDRFFEIISPPKPRPQWLDAFIARAWSIALLVVTICVVIASFIFEKKLSAWHRYRAFRLTFLLFMAVFFGWIAQGQLSIVTPLAALHALLSGKSISFLLYDPFSLIIWITVIISFFVWGRALFCGWLCPFGALQEWIGQIAKWLHIPQFSIPQKLDENATLIKYGALAFLFFIAIARPAELDKAAEIEPFKTAISVGFQREWYFVAYAASCLFISLFSFKAYCRFFCPLGAFMALAGKLRLTDWIERRPECGKPCQLCAVKCQYKAIKPSGEIKYSECFGCLDCVTIFERDDICVAKLLEKKGRSL